MSNNQSQMAEFADNLYENYIKQKIEQDNTDNVSYFKATVVTNNGDGTLSVQQPYDNAITVRCIPDMSTVAAGEQVLVLKFGNGNNASNYLAVAKGDGDPMYKWQQNTVTQDGYVPAPTSSKPYYLYDTSSSGAPAWTNQKDILTRNLLVGDASNFNKNFLYVSTTSSYANANRRAYFSFDSTVKSEFSNIPTELNKVSTAVGFRDIYRVDSSHILCIVTEMDPIFGRRHINYYNGTSWLGWHCEGTGQLQSARITAGQSDYSNIIVVPLWNASALGITDTTTAGYTAYYQALVKKICATYPSCTNYIFVGRASPSSNHFYAVFIYNTSQLSNGLPQYSEGFAIPYDTSISMLRFGTSGYSWYFRGLGTPSGAMSVTIGTDAATIASGTFPTAVVKGSYTFPAGTYWIEFTGEFEYNATGQRQVGISTTSSFQYDSQSGRVGVPASGVYAHVKCSAYRTFTTSTTVNFIMAQNSGTALKTYGRMQYLRLGAYIT